MEFLPSFPDTAVLTVSDAQHNKSLSPLKQPCRLCHQHFTHSSNNLNATSSDLCFNNYHQEKRRSQCFKVEMVLEYFRSDH